MFVRLLWLLFNYYISRHFLCILYYQVELAIVRFFNSVFFELLGGTTSFIIKTNLHSCQDILIGTQNARKQPDSKSVAKPNIFLFNKIIIYTMSNHLNFEDLSIFQILQPICKMSHWIMNNILKTKWWRRC